MLNLFILMILIVLLMTIIMLLPLNITLRVSWLGQNLSISMTIKMLKITIYKKEWDMLSHLQKTFAQDDFSMIVQVFENSLQQWKYYKRILSVILDDITIYHLNWKTYFGTGEASSTGIVFGTIQAIKQMLSSVLLTENRFACQPNIIVKPKFQQKCFQSELDCMFSVKITKAIFIAFTIFSKIGKKEVQQVH